jgi:hypothetical protein
MEDIWQFSGEEIDRMEADKEAATPPALQAPIPEESPEPAEDDEDVPSRD